jgi:TRAP-type C4-dicarboxylate transport system permease large subunit
MIACHVAGMRMADALRDTLIMLMPMFGVLVLIIVWPDVVLCLPKLVSPEFLD